MKLADLERIALQLDPIDQRRLTEGIRRRLKITPPSPDSVEVRCARRLAAIAECDRIADSIDGEFDAAEDLQQIREQRIPDIHN